MGRYALDDLHCRLFDIGGQVDAIGIQIAVDKLPGVSKVPVLQSE